MSEIEINEKMINIDDQKEKTYVELCNLFKVIPHKYNYTRKQIRDLIDLLNCEKYLYTTIEEVQKIEKEYLK